VSSQHVPEVGWPPWPTVAPVVARVNAARVAPVVGATHHAAGLAAGCLAGRIARPPSRATVAAVTTEETRVPWIDDHAASTAEGCSRAQVDDGGAQSVWLILARVTIRTDHPGVNWILRAVWGVDDHAQILRRGTPWHRAKVAIVDPIDCAQRRRRMRRAWRWARER